MTSRATPRQSTISPRSEDFALTNRNDVCTRELRTSRVLALALQILTVAGGVLRTQFSQSDRAQGKSEIAQRNVKETRDQQQVQDDREQPTRHDVSSQARSKCNQRSRAHLDYAYNRHEPMSAYRR